VPRHGLPAVTSQLAAADVLAPDLRVAGLELLHRGDAAEVVEQHDLDALRPEEVQVRASPTTTRGIWKSKIAPVHIWHGDSVVYMVVSA
jgi:hypothetical protein